MRLFAREQRVQSQLCQASCRALACGVFQDALPSGEPTPVQTPRKGMRYCEYRDCHIQVRHARHLGISRQAAT